MTKFFFLLFLAGINATRETIRTRRPTCEDYLNLISEEFECYRGNRFGKGSMGEVFKVLRKTDKTLFVMKVSQWNPKDEPEKFAAMADLEIRAMQACDHRNVIKLVEHKKLPTEKRPTLVIMIMELAEHGDLSGYIHQMRGKGLKFSTEDVLTLLHQIAEGLDHLHSKGFVHRDIKLENIGIDGKTPKILDFGLACEKNQGFEHVPGTPTHVDPFPFTFARENRKNFLWTSASDVYGLGVVLHELIQGELMYQEKGFDPNQTHVRARASTDYKLPEGMDETVAYLINRMTLLDPKARITLPEVMKEIEEHQISKVHFQIKETTLDNLTLFERSAANRRPQNRLLSVLRIPSLGQIGSDRVGESGIQSPSQLII